MRTFDDFINLDGKKLTIYRNGHFISSIIGLYSGECKFDVPNDCQIEIGDTILFVAANKHYTVESIEPIPCFEEDEIDFLEVSCFNHAKKSNSKIINYNVTNAYGSSFGENASAVWNGNIFNLDELIIKHGHDPKEFENLITTLNAAIRKDECKQGFLEKFSDMLAKHSWLAEPIAQQLLSYFMGNK